MKVGELFTILSVDNKKYNSGLDAAENKAKQTAKTIGNIFDNAFSFSVGMGVFEAVKAGVDMVREAIVGTNAELSRARVGFAQMLGSADAASTFIERMQKFADDTPFEFSGLQQLSYKLLGAGWAANKIIPDLKAVGDAIEGTGGGKEQLASVVRALTQIKAKGKVSAEELMQIAEANIPAYQILADKLGLTGDQVANIGEESIAADTAIAALISGLDERYGGSMEAQKDQWQSLTSTISDGLKMLFAGIGQGAFDEMRGGLMSIRDMVSSMMTSFRSGGLQQVFKEFVPADLQPKIAAFINAIAPLATTMGQVLKSLGAVLLDIGQTALTYFGPPLIAAFTLAAGGANLLMVAARGILNSWGTIGPIVYGVIGAFLAFRTVTIVTAAITAINAAIVGLQARIIAFRAVWIANWAAMTGIPMLLAAAASLGAIAIAAAIAVIVAAGIWLYNHWEEVSSAIGAAWEWYKGVVTYIGSAIMSFLQEHASGIYNVLTSAWEWIKENVISKVQALVAGITGPLSSMVGWIKGLFSGAADAINGALNTGKDTMSNWLNSFTGATHDASKGADELAKHLGKASVSFSDKDATKAAENIGKEFERLAEGIDREWNQTMLSQLQQLDIWKNEQLAALDKVETANIDAAEQIRKVWDIYYKKRAEMERQASERTKALIDETKNRMAEISNQTIRFDLKGGNAGVFDIQTNGDKRIKEVDDLVKRWHDGTREIKDQYGQLITDQLILDEWAKNQRTTITQQTVNEQLNYIRTGQALEDELRAAHNQSDLESYIQLLNDKNAAFLADLEGQQAIIDVYRELQMAAHRSDTSIMAEMYRTAYQSLSSGITSAIMGAKSFGQAMKEAGKAIVEAYVRMRVEQLIGAALSKSLAAAALALSTAQAAALTAIWGPPAFLANTATMGSAGEIGLAGIEAGLTAMSALASTSKVASGSGGGMGDLKAADRYAGGGSVSGSGSGRSDSILSWLSNGEFVMTDEATRYWGVDFLNDINQMHAPSFAMGGLAGGFNFSGPDFSPEVTQVTVGRGSGVSVEQNIYGDVKTEADLEQLRYDLGEDLRYALMGT